MMNKQTDKELTDQAWNTLYTRLEAEQLLDMNYPEVRKYRMRVKCYWIAAAVLIGCICTSVAYWFRPVPELQNREFITLTNSDQSAALATTLEDGSVIYLADQTSLSFPASFDQDVREVELRGSAQFDVTGNPERPFIIDTHETRIEVIGTAFQVKSESDKPFGLVVQQGKVKVTAKSTGESVFVQAGEFITWQAGQFEHKQNVVADDFFTRRIHFKDETLETILHVINKQNGSLRFAVDPALAGRRLTLTFATENPEMMAELICLALNLQYQKEEQHIRIFE